MKRVLAVALFAAAATAVAGAQAVIPPGPVPQIKDTAALQPPKGARVAVVEFEDLECPHCGYAAPLIRAAVAKHHIPYVHHDFPIHIGQWWSLNAAISACILQDTVSPEAAEQFRLDVFANQRNIASEQDLQKFTQQWFARHKAGSGFSMDPRFRSEVMADEALALKMGLTGTPAIFVVNRHGWIQVNDPTQMDAAIEKSEQTAGPAAATQKASSHPPR
jgi:protein-disulfide isomerase